MSTGLLLLTAFAATTVNAAPTAELRGGATIVRLSDDFLGAVTTLGVAVAPEQSARVKGRYAVFPIPAGALDLGSLAGDVLHSGGLSLTAGPTQVKLLSFIIDTTSLTTEAPRPVLTGIVTADDSVIARVPLFDLTLNKAPTVTRKGRVIISKVDVRLSAEAAGALNALFQVDAFAEGLLIGEAKVYTAVDRRGGKNH